MHGARLSPRRRSRGKKMRINDLIKSSILGNRPGDEERRSLALPLATERSPAAEGTLAAKLILCTARSPRGHWAPGPSSTARVRLSERIGQRLGNCGPESIAITHYARRPARLLLFPSLGWHRSLATEAGARGGPSGRERAHFQREA